jgi:hypothetical protein
MASCTPAVLYAVIALLYIIQSIYMGLSALSIFAQIIFAVLITVFLSFLCNQGFGFLSWIIFLLIFFILMSYIGFVIFIKSKQSQGLSGRKPLPSFWQFLRGE